MPGVEQEDRQVYQFGVAECIAGIARLDERAEQAARREGRR